EEQAIGQHLGEGVGELLEAQFMENLVAKNLEKRIELALAVFPLLAHQFFAEIVAEQLAAGRERKRQLLRPTDAFGCGREETVEQARDRRDAISVRPEARIFEISRMA